YIVREMLEGHGASAEIAQAYKQYLERLREENNLECEKYGIEEERIQRMDERFGKIIEKASAEDLFGIEGFNDTPKLLFNDLLPIREKANKDDWFSIDSKNSIELSSQGGMPRVLANPRTYRVVRPGVSFVGDVLLYNTEKLKLNGQNIGSRITDFIKEAMIQFNSGIYRLGNSGSRGYGRVEIEFVGEDSWHG
ncbi:hypothetical protein, partial [Paenibacillus terrae]|uniref:hypothetical protein n=1 Tax=Paenibacillus terrae TaxID=159743 RepID=UPI001BAFB25B